MEKVLSPKVSFFLGATFGIGAFFLSLSIVFAADVTVTATVPAICGNGTTEGSEQCDDSNTTNGDGCSSTCTTETTEGGGDDGDDTPPGAQCGNGTTETGEQCDDGNQASGDGCTGACQLEGPPAPVCGNTILESGEQCDDGNFSSGDGCSNACQIEFPPSVCGNGAIQGAEQCDDGNTASGDGCSSSCVIESAGPACGNGDIEGSEQCDDGDLSNGDGCSFSCQIEGGITLPTICGDGLPEGTEQCDDGNTNSGDGCSGSCQTEGVSLPPDDDTGGGTAAICGNSILEGIEQCDDGNLSDGDGCSVICQEETIGEEIIETINNIQEVIDGDGSTIDKTVQIAEIIGSQIGNAIENSIEDIGDGIEVIQEVIDDPQIEDITEHIVVPTVIAAAALAVVPSLWSILLPLFRFLFLQPLLLFGKRKRKEWGMVYNSLDKTPIDLAIVRLIDIKKNVIVRSQVTDREGRYLVSVPAGEYRIEVNKQQLTFPSELMKTVATDGSLLDLYHGEPILVTGDDTRITPNIPLDPIGATKTPKRITWERRLRVLQHVVSLAGIITTAIALYITPTWQVGVFLLLHLIFYILFLRFVRPKHPKDWGIVYDVADQTPVQKAIARLFSIQYNKLIDTEITDNKGRYAFLVGPNNYYVTVEKEGYAPVTKEVTVKQGEQVVKEQFGIQKIQTPDHLTTQPSLKRALYHKE